MDSESERNGLSKLKKSDKKILSIGISTEGHAEMEMVRAQKGRIVIATTIDRAGLEHTKRLVKENHMDGQIDARLEDIREKMPYPDREFDFIYARLVLHYLDKKELVSALDEMNRVLRPGGHIYIVVRSTKSSGFSEGILDINTGMTTYSLKGGKIFKRYFHSEKTIRQHLETAGFTIIEINEHIERLCKGYFRDVLSDETDYVIEVFAEKKHKA